MKFLIYQKKKKKTITFKKTKNATTWIPVIASRKQRNHYNYKKRVGKRNHQPLVRFYHSRCYRLLSCEFANVILPQTITFLKGMKKHARRLTSSLVRPTILTTFYNIFWNLQARRSKGSRMGSGKSPLVTSTATWVAGQEIITTSELRNTKVSALFVLKQNKKKINAQTKIKYICLSH